MIDITTIGEILIDLTQTGVSEDNIPVYLAFPGGAPANVAVAAARHGAKTAFIGKVGNDAYFDGLISAENLVTEETICGLMTELKPYGFVWLLIKNRETEEI